MHHEQIAVKTGTIYNIYTFACWQGRDAAEGHAPKEITIRETADSLAFVSGSETVEPTLTLKSKSKKKCLSKDTLLYRAVVPSPPVFKSFDDDAEGLAGETLHLLSYKLSKATKVMVGVLDQTLGAAIDENDIQFIYGIGDLKKGSIPKAAGQDRYSAVFFRVSARFHENP